MNTYPFRCSKCDTEVDVQISITKYDEEKDKQLCPKCNSKMERILVWNTGVNLCSGMYGIHGKEGWN